MLDFFFRGGFLFAGHLISQQTQEVIKMNGTQETKEIMLEKSEEEIRKILGWWTKSEIEETLERIEEFAPWEEGEMWLKEILEEELEKKDKELKERYEKYGKNRGKDDKDVSKNETS